MNMNRMSVRGRIVSQGIFNCTIIIGLESLYDCLGHNYETSYVTDWLRSFLHIPYNFVISAHLTFMESCKRILILD